MTQTPARSSSPWQKLRLWPFVLLMVLAVAIAAATLVEEVWGTAAAHRAVYGSVWFTALWVILAALGVRVMLRLNLWKRPATLALHLSFLMILCGALLTALTARRGYLHLRQGVPSSHYARDNSAASSLPFTARLDSFYILHYPGTEAPQDYVSHVRIQDSVYVISMNRIAEVQGYRLYQSSYDPDLQGTVLKVNYDPWGTGLTYAGYLMLALSMMCSLLADVPWIRRLQNRRKTAGCIMALLMMGLPAKADPLPTLPQSRLLMMEQEQVIWNDRVAPMGTMAQEFLLKIYGHRTYRGLSPMQVVTSWQMDPQQWASQPIIKLTDGGYGCLNDYIDYSTMPPQLKGLGTDARTDEKVGLILMLMQGSLVKPLPEGVEPASPTRIRAELFYNRIDWTLWSMIACFVLVVASGICAYVRIRFVQSRHALLSRLVHAGSMLLWLFLAVSFVLRWYIAARIPLANSYETMVFVALCILSLRIAVPSLRRETGALLPAAFVLLVAHLGETDPCITPLVPVLHSPWLSAHVSIIMLSYAMLVLSIIDRRMLKTAVFLLAVGIFLGAVWANVSWGSYWSWDPKESWALVTMLVYSLPLHTQSIPWLKSDRAYRIYSVVALCCLAMTYWGVNHLLGGMHSYN